MKVKELIEKLQQLNQEAMVVHEEYIGIEYVSDVNNVKEYKKGDKLDTYIEGSCTEYVDCCGIAHVSVVFIE